MNRWNILLVLVVVLSLAAFSVPATAAPAVLGILEVRGLDSLAAAGFELSKATGNPIPKESLTLMLYGALGTMPGMGIQPYEKVRALWLAGRTDKGSVAVLLPVDKEGAEFLEGLGHTGWKQAAETADGILYYQADPAAGTPWQDMYFLPREGILIAGLTADDVRRADAAMADLPPILPVEGDVAIQLHPTALAAEFGEKLLEEMGRVYRSNDDVPAPVAEISDLYARAYLAVARQMESVVISVGVADGNLNVHSRVVPVPGTTFHNWFTTVGAPSAAASVVNLPETLMVETLHLGDLNLLAPAYFRYVKALMNLVPGTMSPEALDACMDLAQAYWQQMGGDFGIALFPPTLENPLRLAEYFALKDPVAARALTAQLLQGVNEMFQSLTASEVMPVRFELVTGEPRTYRDIPVDRLVYRLMPGDEIKDAWPKSLPTELAVELAWIPGGALACLGDSALTDAVVDRALDGVASPVAEMASWKALFPVADPELVDLAHAALFDAMRAYTKLFDSQTGSRHAEFIPAGSGSLGGLSYKAMGGMMSRVRFRLDDIGAVVRKIQEVREKAMAAMMEQMMEFDEMEFDEEDDFSPLEEEGDEEWRPEAGSAEPEEEPGAEVAPEPVPAAAE